MERRNGSVGQREGRVVQDGDEKKGQIRIEEGQCRKEWFAEQDREKEGSVEQREGRVVQDGEEKEGQ